MKILVLTHEFPPLGGGGGHVARDLCQELAKLGHDLKVISADLLGGVGEEKLQHSYQLIRVPTLRKDPARASMVAMVSFLLSALLWGLAEIRRWKPDLIHVHFAVPSGPIAWVLSLLTGLPYLITIHLGDIPGGTPEKTDRWFKFIKPLTYPIWNRASKIVAVSSYSRQLALEHYQVPIDVVHNGVDLSLYPQQDIKVHSPPRIAFAGRFVPQKNPLTLIRVLGSIKHLDWELKMMGDGELFTAVQREVHQLELEDRISLTGWVSPETVREIFMESDILFMPSLSEGLPVVGVQALACGLAFVVSDIGGFADIVDSGKNGYSVEVDSQEQISIYSDVLTELLTNHQMLANYKQYSADKSKSFDLGQITRSYSDLFLEISS
jgi:glycosyltransferase involved in cell wall biosynthesis